LRGFSAVITWETANVKATSGAMLVEESFRLQAHASPEGAGHSSADGDVELRVVQMAKGLPGNTIHRCPQAWECSVEVKS
jgi:hypothetical protein